MWTSTFLNLATLTFLSHELASVHAIPHPFLSSRNIVESPRSDSYDFVICGGGTAGLALAARLSENSSTTVLVIEAGKSGDDVRSQIDYPQSTYYESFVGTDYDWAYSTAAQGNANNRNFAWPRGKVLGGSTAINGLYMTRLHQDEVNAWQDIISSEDSTAAKKWGWDSLSAYIRKAETFHAANDDVASTASITHVDSYHGTSGPVHYAFPAVTRPVIGTWVPTLSAVGITPRDDPAGGNNEGGYISTVAENPTNYTRSYARAAYIDPLPPRSNLDIIAGVQVTRIIFDSSSTPKATGVEYAASAGAEKKTVNVNKEVILSAGVIGSTQILQLSGVGPKDVVEAAGVSSVVALDGVGHHLQDHIKAGIVFKANGDTAGNIHTSDASQANTTEFRSYISSAIGYVNLTTLFGSDGANTIASSATDAMAASASSVPSGSTEVADGFKAIYQSVVSLFGKDVPQVEILLTDMFAGSITLQAGIQHPLSAGRVYINSSSPFEYPVIDPQYLTHATDRAILREGLKLVRKISQTDPLKSYLAEESSPGSSVDTDDAWDTWIAENSVTEYHPCGTNAMLPKSKGGVVNAELSVYGLSNVRVVDASVFPFDFSSHLMTPTYALAEAAADIIKAHYSPTATSSNSSSQSSQSSSSPNSSFKISSPISMLSVASLLVLHTLLASLL